METIWIISLACIAVLVIFDFTNGFNDTANMIASAVASRAMTPTQAIIVVSSFTFLGPLLGGTAVADTVGTFVHLNDLQAMDAVSIIASGAAGAVTLNLIVWWRGLPSSSTHALVGGLAGAVMATAGADHVVWGWQNLLHGGHLHGVTLIVAALFLSPPLGLAMGWAMHHLLRLLLRNASPAAGRVLGRLQWLGVASLAFSHGANDAQKTMGVITLVLLLSGSIASFAVPLWVIVMCACSITLGTILGGWRIIRTVGFGIYKLRPIHAFSSQLTAAAVIGTAAAIGGPVSTTHVVSSSIMGVGAADRPRSVRWGKAAEIVFTWVVTLPAAGLLGIAFHAILARLLP